MQATVIIEYAAQANDRGKYDFYIISKSLNAVETVVNHILTKNM